MNLYYSFVEETLFVVVIKSVDYTVSVVVIEEEVYSYFVEPYLYSVDKNSLIHSDKNIIVVEDEN